MDQILSATRLAVIRSSDHGYQFQADSAAVLVGTSCDVGCQEVLIGSEEYWEKTRTFLEHIVAVPVKVYIIFDGDSELQRDGKR